MYADQLSWRCKALHRLARHWLSPRLKNYGNPQTENLAECGEFEMTIGRLWRKSTRLVKGKTWARHTPCAKNERIEQNNWI